MREFDRFFFTKHRSRMCFVVFRDSGNILSLFFGSKTFPDKRLLCKHKIVRIPIISETFLLNSVDNYFRSKNLGIFSKFSNTKLFGKYYLAETLESAIILSNSSGARRTVQKQCPLPFATGSSLKGFDKKCSK